MKYTGRTATRRLLTLASSATLLLTLWPASAVRPRARAAGRRAESATRNAVAETPARLLFTSDRDGNAEVYVKETAAGPEINLTKNPGRDGNPVWSPDGTRVAFTSDRSGRPNIYVMNADGSNVRKITRNDEGVDVRVYDPAWSPDGTRLAYVSSFMGELSSLLVTNADGTGGPQLLGSFSEVADPAWSPDGTRIALAARTANSFPGGVVPLVRYDIFVVNADGSGQTRVADRAAPFQSFDYPAEGSGPAWSPDGSRLAFASLRDGRAELFTCTATGGDLRRVTDEALARETQPACDNQNCDRVMISSGFFRSREFHVRGLFVYNFYRAALGRPVTYEEFTADLLRVSADTAEALEQRRASYAQQFTERDDFRALYGGVFGGAAFVDKVLQTAGVQSPSRDSWIADLSQGRKTRAQVLREIVESREVVDRHFNAAFVTMQYFGYLKRDPEITGFNAWLAYLNANPQDFRTMIRGFVRSREYRNRFGQP